jgi:uncharacterized membrane protein
VLIIGVGGPQVARVANCLARFGVVPDTCALPMVPFIPETAEELSAWEAIILGPLPGGAHRFTDGQLEALTAYVRDGGGMVFVGGMDSFSGAGDSAGYHATSLTEVMPVELRPGNDHEFLRETPQVVASHALLKGLPREWPPIGERNRHPARPDAQVLVRFTDDPLLVVRDVGEGRSVALMTAWNWKAQHEFTLWEGFARLWLNAVEWAGRVRAPRRPVHYALRRGGGDAFRFAATAGRPLLQDADGSERYYCGTSIEARTLDFIPRSQEWGANLYHFWNDYIPDYVRACQLAQDAGVKLALFVPQVAPFARFHDGAISADNTPYPVPWHRVPDFYDPEWQGAFRTEARRLAEALAPYRDVVAIMWATNEPEIYHGWGDWSGPDFCLNTPAALHQARLHAEETYATVGQLNADWTVPAEHQYSFGSWGDFEGGLLDAMFADVADGRMSRPASQWLLRFVTRRWLRDWHGTVVRICREEGLTGPAFGVRHNYNSVPDFALLPWDDLDLCGKNLYTHEDADDYVHETWDAFRSSGLPVLMSEWGVQPSKPPLGYIGGDEVRRAEQAVVGRVLASRCPWVVGDIWCNVMDIDFPWGFLDPDTGVVKPFVPMLARAAEVPPTGRWNPVRPAPFRLTVGRFEAAGVTVHHTDGSADREPGVRFP